MDIARYIMAIAVIVAHFNELAGHDFYFPLTSFEGVGGFFAISGFLMYPSYIRSANIISYVKNRARRILPPYFFVVAIFAVGLVLVSQLNPLEYFTSSGFWKYLVANLSFLNWLHPDLPGVFQGNEYYISAVNGSLWTMKIEWCLYLSVPIVMWLTHRLKWEKKYVAIIIIFISCVYRLAFNLLYESTEKEIYRILSRQVFGQLSFFYAGMFIYFIQDFFYRFRKYILIIGIILYTFTKSIPYSDIFLAPVFIASIIMAFSMLKHTWKRLTHSNNLSYNIYLFHFPIIQLSIYTGINNLPEWISFGFILCTTIAMSTICMWAIERPLKRRFVS